MWQHDISDTQRAAYFHCNPKAKSVTRSDLVAWLAEQSRKATKHPATKRAAARKAA